jgi:hypothetical protein
MQTTLRPTHVCQKICIRMFIATFCIIASCYKKLRCPPTTGWVNIVACFFNGIIYSNDNE